MTNSITVESPEAARAKGDDDAYRFGRPPEGLPSYDPAPPSRLTDPGNITLLDLDLRQKKDRNRFMDMTQLIYAGDPNYITPLRLQQNRFLDPNHNPAFKNLEVRALLALENGRPVGRLTVQIDAAYNKYHQTQAGFFGFFESINDRKVAHALLNEGLRWLKNRGVQEVFGPTNFTTNHTSGLLIENFERPPFVEETYNPRYYEELFRSFGFGKAKDLLVWWIDIANGMTSKNRERVARIADKVKKREGVVIRPINLKDADNEIERMYTLYLQAWQKNWGFVPLAKEEFAWLAQDLKQAAIPDLVLFVELNGKPVGFSATLPDVNEVLPKNGRLFPFAWLKLIGGGLKKTKNARLYTLGMLPEFRKRGLETMMFAETVTRAQSLGIAGGEIGWTLEDNDLINRAIETMDGAIDRRYRILGMKL